MNTFAYALHAMNAAPSVIAIFINDLLAITRASRVGPESVEIVAVEIELC